MPDRTIMLTSPSMEGGDVLLLQSTVNAWLGRWTVPHRIEQDAVYGADTRAATLLVCYGLGIAKAATAHGITPDIRRKLRDPARRTLVERRRGNGRAEWRERLKHRFHENGPSLAVAYAERMAAMAVHEQPAGSNRGPTIDEWNRMVGTPLGPAAYWCGAFANACLVAAGFTPMPFMKSCVEIEHHALGRVDGWSWHGPAEAPRTGRLALFTEKGVAGHVELVVRNGWPLRTVGGNTSSGDGSPSNGGGVFRHDFSRYAGLPLRGFAAPAYH
jgi:hypothetical protein